MTKMGLHKPNKHFKPRDQKQKSKNQLKMMLFMHKDCTQNCTTLPHTTGKIKNT